MFSSIQKAVKTGCLASSLAIWTVTGCGIDSSVYPENSSQQDLSSSSSALSKNCETLCNCLAKCDMKIPDVACFKACFEAATPESGGCMCLGLVPPDDGTSPIDGNTGSGGTITGGSGGSTSGGSASSGGSDGGSSGEEGVGIDVTSK